MTLLLPLLPSHPLQTTGALVSLTVARKHTQKHLLSEFTVAGNACEHLVSSKGIGTDNLAFEVPNKRLVITAPPDARPARKLGTWARK